MRDRTTLERPYARAPSLVRRRWRSLASAIAIGTAASIGVAAMELPGRSTYDQPGSAAAATTGVGSAMPSRVASSRARADGAVRTEAGQPAFILYMLMEASRPLPLFAH
jgi:hypothetical protein